MNYRFIFNGIHACFAGAIQLIAQKITKPNSIIDYFYDPMGNRIGKAYTENNQTTYTWYVRDAQGNPMATYEQKTVNNSAQIKLIELPIYGSSRLGMLQPNKLITENTPVNSSFSIGRKQYEISNHLGNVLTTISDAKQAIDNNTDGVVDYYKPIIKTQQDYYPFGMLMPKRQYEQPSGYEDVTTIQAVTNFTIYSNNYNGNVIGADKILDQNNYPNTSSTVNNGSFRIASTQNATTSYGYFYAIEARQGTYTITFDYQATGTANRRFFVTAYNLNSQGIATNLLYPINTQNMTNGSKTFTFTYTGTGRQYLSFAFYITNHTNPLATRFFTIDNFTVKFTGNYPFTETVAVYDGKDYRYGFNGQERSDEVYGKGNLNTALFWEYDTRLGRRWNLDPVVKLWESGYACFANNPVWNVDPNGADTLTAPTGEDFNAGTGYKSAEGGKYLYGDGLTSKIFDPNYEGQGMLSGGGGYIDYDGEIPDVGENAQSNGGHSLADNVGLAGTIGDPIGGGAKGILDNRGAYMPRGQIYGMNKEITVRTPIANINTTSRVLNYARVGGKVLGVAGVVATGYQVYGDIDGGRYYSAGTRAAVFGVAAGFAFIPVVGWGVAAGIGVADYIWGDHFYNYVENRMR